MYDWNAVCCAALSTSPVVESQTTAWYWARLDAVKAVASSVAVTENPLAAPSCWIAAMPFGMEECRKPAVLEKTSTRVSGAAAAAGDAATSVPTLATASPTAEIGRAHV